MLAREFGGDRGDQAARDADAWRQIGQGLGVEPGGFLDFDAVGFDFPAGVFCGEGHHQ